MTLSNVPFAIDGPLISSAHLRKALYAAIGTEGVVGDGDLLVSANTPEGQSLLVAPGSGVVLNGYQSTPNEVYVATNPSLHTVTSGEMPGSSGGTTYWMVALVIGDPQAGFSQTGHPFMPSDFDEGEANTYQYARVLVLPCASGDTTFADLGVDYPGLALARLEIPGSTTTITSGMITDLRVLASDGGNVNTDWIQFGDAGGPTYGTSWAYHGSAERPAIQRRGSKVSVRGLVKRTAGASTTMFTLPVGMRPSLTTIRSGSVHGGASAGITINTDGTVIAPSTYVTNNQYVVLEFDFDIDQPTS